MSRENVHLSFKAATVQCAEYIPSSQDSDEISNPSNRETPVHSTLNWTAVRMQRLRIYWSARLHGVPSSIQALWLAKYTGVVLHKEEALMILQTSEYLANLQSHHYEWHLSHLHRCADVPIKSMIALFFPQREHTAIKAEQEKTACLWRLRVMLKSTIQLYS